MKTSFVISVLVMVLIVGDKLQATVKGVPLTGRLSLPLNHEALFGRDVDVPVKGLNHEGPPRDVNSASEVVSQMMQQMFQTLELIGEDKAMAIVFSRSSQGFPTRIIPEIYNIPLTLEYPEPTPPPPPFDVYDDSRVDFNYDIPLSDADDVIFDIPLRDSDYLFVKINHGDPSPRSKWVDLVKGLLYANDVNYKIPLRDAGDVKYDIPLRDSDDLVVKINHKDASSRPQLVDLVKGLLYANNFNYKIPLRDADDVKYDIPLSDSDDLVVKINHEDPSSQPQGDDLVKGLNQGLNHDKQPLSDSDVEQGLLRLNDL